MKRKLYGLLLALALVAVGFTTSNTPTANALTGCTGCVTTTVTQVVYGGSQTFTTFHFARGSVSGLGYGRAQIVVNTLGSTAVSHTLTMNTWAFGTTFGSSYSTNYLTIPAGQVAFADMGAYITVDGMFATVISETDGAGFGVSLIQTWQ